MQWLTLALLSALFAALSTIVGKLGVAKVDSTVTTMVRAAVGFMMLGVFVLALGKMNDISTLRGKDALYVILTGIFGTLSWLFYFWALKVGKVSQVAPIDRFSAVFAVILAVLLLGEKISWKTGLGAVIMTIGAILVALG